MGDIDIHFIGAGNAFAPSGMCWNGFLLQKRILFETPPQALMSVQRAAVNPNDLDLVVISHHHGDHFYGLPMLMLWWKWMGRTKPLQILAPRETERITRDLARETYPWLFDIAYPVEWIAAEPGKWHEFEGIRIRPVEVTHDDELVQCLGFACEVGGKKLAYTGDTVYCPGVEELAQWAEVLIADCSSIGPNPVHMSLEQDIPKVRGLQPDGAQLILTHIDLGVAASELTEGVVCARDEMVFWL